MIRARFNGVTVDTRTSVMLTEAQRLWGRTMRPSQGSYSNSVSASARTHSGGGAVDLSTTGLTAASILNLVKWLRTVGFVAWHRTPADGFDSHVHAIAVACPDLAPAASRQVTQARNGTNGLANFGPDPHAALNIPVTTWEQYQARPQATRFPLVPPFRFGDRANTRGPWRYLTLQSGNGVKKINAFLGFNATSIYTPNTATAVRAWQAKRGLPTTGAVDSRIWKRMGL